MKAFGFDSGFISMIKTLYSEVESVLKMNGDLCSPFRVYRGVRQGCALSGMLYSLALEPLLKKIRSDVCGLYVPNCGHSFKLSAYADDVIVLISGTSDVNVLIKILGTFNSLSSAKVNWKKSEAFLVGKWLKGEPRLPDGLKWNRDGFKYLGMFLGNAHFVKKNFEGILEKVKGRLDKWKYLLPKMSYKGRILIVNNLVSSALWHRLICIDPPADVLAKIQSILIDFFWDKLHWVQKSVLYLSKEEGGLGLINLQSRTAAFRLQYIQRLLSSPMESSWASVACAILRNIEGLGLDKALFWLDPQRLKLCDSPVFYRNLFKVWSLFRINRGNNGISLFWFLQEPLVCGSRLDLSHDTSFAIPERTLRIAGVTTVDQLYKIAGPDFKNVTAIAGHLRFRSCRVVQKALEIWSSALTGEEK